MRIISVSRLRDFWEDNPDSEKELKIWIDVTWNAAWKNTADVKSSFGVRVDFVQANSGSRLAVFDIKNNVYRMITAIHYLQENSEKGRVYVLRIFDHKEYDKNKWKEEL